jgi:hypothetical protein
MQYHNEEEIELGKFLYFIQNLPVLNEYVCVCMYVCIEVSAIIHR